MRRPVEEERSEAVRGAWEDEGSGCAEGGEERWVLGGGVVFVEEVARVSSESEGEETVEREWVEECWEGCWGSEEG